MTRRAPGYGIGETETGMVFFQLIFLQELRERG